MKIILCIRKIDPTQTLYICINILNLENGENFLNTKMKDVLGTLSETVGEDKYIFE